MHSKIITLSIEPVDGSLLHEDDLVEHGFVPWIADYVDSQVSDESASAIIQDWVKSLEKMYGEEYISNTDETIVFHKGFKVKFFITIMEKLNKEFFESRPKSLEEYNTNSMMFMKYRLESILNDKHGLYIYSDIGLQTAYDFYESLTENIPYYYGNVVDYHF